MTLINERTDKNRSMNLIRTFHPIGQGAFYTERHNFNNVEFTVVYDCGSTTLFKEKLNNKIKSTFPKGQQIDILFISHFHTDHINGIETLTKHCNIRRVVMPYLDTEAKTLILINNFIDNNYADTRLIDNPTALFGDAIPIITIDPTEIDLDSDGIVLGDPIEISTINSSTNYPSGTVFKLIADLDWLYIPFNYKHDKRKNQLIRLLSACGLTLNEINTINKINKNKRHIKKAYQDVEGDLNKNSMILFSGKKLDDEIQCFNHTHNSNFHYFYHFRFQSGCLYMGDIDLTEPDIINDIKAKLKELLSEIGTLQVPHHGSVHNFADTILQSKIRWAVFSYGSTNTYGHPSDRVISDIIANNIYPNLVTEEQLSIVIQWK